MDSWWWLVTVCTSSLIFLALKINFSPLGTSRSQVCPLPHYLKCSRGTSHWGGGGTEQLLGRGKWQHREFSHKEILPGEARTLCGGTKTLTFSGFQHLTAVNITPRAPVGFHLPLVAQLCVYKMSVLCQMPRINEYGVAPRGTRGAKIPELSHRVLPKALSFLG